MVDANVMHVTDSAWCRQGPKVCLCGHSLPGVSNGKSPLHFLSKISITQCAPQGLPVILHLNMIAERALKLQ